VFTRYESLPAVGTGEGLLVLNILQQAGKRKNTGKEFLHGSADWPGA
jgi:methionyl-tRNA formyltransferase